MQQLHNVESTLYQRLFNVQSALCVYSHVLPGMGPARSKDDNRFRYAIVHSGYAKKRIAQKEMRVSSQID